MPLSAEQRRRLLSALFEAAGQPAPPAPVVDALFARGPIKAFGQLRALPQFGRRQQHRLRAAVSHSELATTLASALHALTQTEMYLPERHHNLPHPFGEAATFEPKIAKALGYEGGLVYGKPRTLPGFPFGERIIHFRQAVRRPAPRSGLILGGGYIGCEMALAWAEAGATVTLLDRADTLLTAYDPVLIDRVAGMLQAAGVRTWLRVNIGGCRPHNDQIAIAGRYEGKPVLLTADVLLMAVGVKFSHKRR